MVDVEKTLMAIEEKKRWEKREDEILGELKEVRSKKKELKKEAKELKDKISEAESAIKSISGNRREVPNSPLNLSEEIKRM